MANPVIKAILFDMDDTLVSNEYPFSNINEAMKEYLLECGVNRSLVAGFRKTLEGLFELGELYPDRKWDFLSKLSYYCVICIFSIKKMPDGL